MDDKRELDVPTISQRVSAAYLIVSLGGANVGEATKQTFSHPHTNVSDCVLNREAARLLAMVMNSQLETISDKENRRIEEEFKKCLSFAC